MDERGKIRERAFAGQITDFTGLRWGTITPTTGIRGKHVRTQADFTYRQ